MLISISYFSFLVISRFTTVNISLTSFQLKGNGWYANDYKDKKEKKKKKADKGEEKADKKSEKATTA